ncbi:MAG: isoprenylcysteine carboxylmethyltransferase family protein [Deltaproteobacteria bacterium]|nr:isoprenylcysteine carboxylmethyltransferase family protein [Deltaproteobacteria bacterium]
MIFRRILLFLVLMLAMFFLPAGSFAFWQAWVYLTLIFVCMLAFLIYFLKNDPELLERRMRSKEKETEQRLIIAIMSVCCLFTFLLPGFDKRFGWSDVPVTVVIIADGVVLLGYGFVFLVLRENSYASRIIEVEEGQQVISSGPYALVRHPMYLGVALMFLFTPLALGSYWTLIPSILMIFVLVPRIFNEEKVLQRDLDGYREYMQKVRYRLIPGIW